MLHHVMSFHHAYPELTCRDGIAWFSVKGGDGAHVQEVQVFLDREDLMRLTVEATRALGEMADHEVFASAWQKKAVAR